MVEAFSSIPTAIISDNLNRMVAAGPTVRPMHRGGSLAGTALTVKTRPGDQSHDPQGRRYGSPR